jgi:glycosyltransferase involved in cell wall biosynthesis
MSVDATPPKALPPLATKERHWTLVFVGRVVPSKRVDHIVRALGLVHRSGLVQARLWIVGSWDQKYRRALDHLIADLGLEGHVTFFGHVDAALKEQLMVRAHVVVMTSVREGWGLAVTEANALGTPAAVYDVPGLRDSTRDGQTGLVCRPNTPSALAQAILSLHAQPLLYARLREQAWVSVQELSWDRTARGLGCRGGLSMTWARAQPLWGLCLSHWAQGTRL